MLVRFVETVGCLMIECLRHPVGAVLWNESVGGAVFAGHQRCGLSLLLSPAVSYGNEHGSLDQPCCDTCPSRAVLHSRVVFQSRAVFHCECQYIPVPNRPIWCVGVSILWSCRHHDALCAMLFESSDRLELKGRARHSLPPNQSVLV